MSDTPNVTQAVPFLWIRDMDVSLRFYVDGLGFAMKLKWVNEGKLEWCWLELDQVGIMLQQYRPELVPETKRGEGVSICFMCRDAIAIYHQISSRGLQPRRPYVGNRLWVTEIHDPDGYHLLFESPTDAEEESVYEG